MDTKLWLRARLLVPLLVWAVFAACASGDPATDSAAEGGGSLGGGSGCLAGHKLCGCRANATCDRGLRCELGLCVGDFSEGYSGADGLLGDGGAAGDNAGAAGAENANGGDGSLGPGSFNETPTCLSIDRTGVRYVPPAGLEVAFRVLDCDGNAVRPLGPSDVAVINDGTGHPFNASTEGGSASPLQSNTDIELYSVLALDLSNSIVNNGRLPDVLAGAKAFVQQVITNETAVSLRHHVAIVGFGSTAKTQVIQDFTKDDLTLGAALDGLADETGRGTTNLYGAYELGLTQLAAHGSASAVVERFLVLVTDGTHEAGDEANLRNKALLRKHATDAAVFTLAVETSDAQWCPLEELAGRGGVVGGTCEIGGCADASPCPEFIAVDDVGKLEGVFEEVSQRAVGIARSNYRLGVCTPVELGNASLTLEVELDVMGEAVSTSSRVDYVTNLLNGDVTTCDAEMAAAIAKGPLACTGAGPPPDDDDDPEPPPPQPAPAPAGSGSCSIACLNLQCGTDKGIACGTCNSEQYCDASRQCTACASATPDGCGTACYDFQTDAKHCGDCAVQCSAQQSCQGGECVCPGVGGELCGDTCRDLDGDKNNCGACDNACAIACSDATCLTAVGLTAGDFHSCVVLSDTTARCWGRNSAGQLGQGTVEAATGPGEVVGLSDIASLSAGRDYTCALLNGGTVYCWGDNAGGALGDGTGAGDGATTIRSAPVKAGLVGATQLSAGYRHACARLDAGTVSCWGDNANGQLGDGTTTQRLGPTPVPNLSDVASVSAGFGHSCARMNDGTMRCWGANSSGQLGDGTTAARVAPSIVPGLSEIAAIAIGNHHTCALVNDGTVRCWGENIYGQLGDGTQTSHVSPSLVSDLANVKSVTAGNATSCAVMNDRTVRCWGVVGGLAPTAVAGLTGVAEIAHSFSPLPSYGHRCARLYDGSVSCWGTNSSGQLGDGTTANKATPVTVVW